MPIVPTRQILEKARREKHGVFSMVAVNFEMALGGVQAAEEAAAPLILVVNPGLVPDISIERAVGMAAGLARSAGVLVAVALLDRGKDFDPMTRALQSGASSVMWDRSALPYEENLRSTAEAARRAHAAGASLDGKLDSIARQADAKAGAAEATDPGKAADFVAETGADSLAVSFGNKYGAGQKAAFDFDRLRALRARIPVPLVMHGGSGHGRDGYPRLVDGGITWFCCYTSIANAAVEELRSLLNTSSPDPVLYHQLVGRGLASFRRSASELIEWTGCKGKGR